MRRVKERLSRIFVLRPMANSYTMPVLGASLLLAAAGGIQLGESTIGMIKPIHFQGPAVHPRDRGAAIDESRIRATEPSFASLYGWEEGQSAKSEDCGDCGALSARDSFVEEYEAPVRIHRATVEEWDESDWSAEEYAGGEEVEARDFDTELARRVGRYAYYEIETEPEVEVHYSVEVE